jgi:competence protein ComEC
MTASDASAPSIKAEPLPTGRAGRVRRLFSGLGAGLEERFDRERDQLPVWLPVGLGLGAAAWFALPDVRAWTAFLLLAAACALAPLALAPGTRWGRAVAIFSLAAALGCLNIWAKADRAAAPRLERERAAEFSATVEAVQPLPAEEKVRVLLRPTGEPRLPPRLRINVDEKDRPAGLEPGSTVHLRAYLMPPAPAAVPGAYDFARAAWFQGIGATGRVLGKVEVAAPAGEQGWRARLASWRQRLGGHIRARLPGGEGGVAAALATGDQGGIPTEDADAMRRSGLAHLLSVSGLHLTAVVGAVMFLTLKLLALSPALALRYRLVLVAAGAGALAGIAYTLLTGAEVPTVRSCIAALLVLAGIALGREALTLRLVAVGALVILVLWPDSLPGPSFQLSFAAITAIVVLHDHPRIRALLARRDEGWAQKVGRGLLGLVLTGLAVEIALAPIALFHFHRTGLYGAFANIVAIPLTTFVIMPLEALALLLDPFGLAAPFWWLTGQALHFLLVLARTAAEAPGAVFLTPAIPNGAFALMVAGGIWLCLWRTDWRRWGLVPLAAGALWALATPPPDLLVTGDGRHLALRTADGDLAILRGRAGDYVRDLFSEASAMDQELVDLDLLPEASCNPDFCAASIGREGRSWRILATRSDRLIDFEPLTRACAAADIVISNRRLPVTCKARWLKADRALLARTGGLAITLGRRPSVATVADQVGRHPWAYTESAAERSWQRYNRPRGAPAFKPDGNRR